VNKLYFFVLLFFVFTLRYLSKKFASKKIVLFDPISSEERLRENTRIRELDKHRLLKENNSLNLDIY